MHNKRTQFQIARYQIKRKKNELNTLKTNLSLSVDHFAFVI